MATPVASYELSIFTGPSHVFDNNRARLILLSKQGDRLAAITFYPPDVELPWDDVRKEDMTPADELELHLPTDMLASVLAL